MIDPRLENIGRDTPYWARVVLAMLCALLTADQIKEALDRIEGGAPDLTKSVAGRRLVDWLGFSRSDMVRAGLSPMDVDVLCGELAARGFAVSPGDPPVATVEPAQNVASEPQPAAETPETTQTSDDTPPPIEASEPLWGGVPESELVGRPYRELLKIEGISPALARRLSNGQRTTAASD